MWLITGYPRAKFLLMFRKRKISVAICGARGIGKIHARIFDLLGFEICGILGSSKASAEQARVSLKDSLKIETRAFSSFKDLIKEVCPQAVSICTPSQVHFEEISLAFENDIAVFCEKPFFWHKGISKKDIEERLLYVEKHPGRRLFVNTSNAYFLEEAAKKIQKVGKINSFRFSFHTQGSHQARDIALDLLPHGISCILQLLGVSQISRFKEKIEKHNYKCDFNYAGVSVTFNFQESPGGPKMLEFEIDGHKFSRIQKGYGLTYQVYLRDDSAQRNFEVKDPFFVYMKRFLDYCLKGASPAKDQFEISAANLRLMGNILIS